MEKEEKLAEAKRKQEEMSFYGMLRGYYPYVALLWVCLLRIILSETPLDTQTFGCGITFCVMSLTIVNTGVTMICALIT